MEEKDFMEMRNQINLLKNKLNQQEIINNRLIKSSMRDKQQEINRKGIKTSIIAAIAIPLWIGVHYATGISWALAIATSAMMIFCIAATWYCHYPINKAGLLSSDVKTVARAFAQVKHMYHIWITRFTPTLILPWLAWVCYEYQEVLPVPAEQKYFLYAAILGGAFIGFLIGYRIHCKVVNACQEIIDQLEEV
ncbi:MAG: hypothetical protein KBT20_04535 [Bacteroidales bacterium]|nr:hypothetical protein [Candidatus Liminaster caballi]